MKKTLKHWLVAVGGLITFLIPVAQLAIGFNNIVKNGENPNTKCEAAPDLPLLLAIGGIFALFFFGTAYGFLKMMSSIGKVQSDVAGKMPKILIGLVSFIFGAITLIFFILIQIRVYTAYSNNVQYVTQSVKTYCRSTVMRGALAMIILTYINVILFISIVILILVDIGIKIQDKKQTEMEMVERNNVHRL